MVSRTVKPTAAAGTTIAEEEVDPVLADESPREGHEEFTDIRKRKKQIRGDGKESSLELWRLYLMLSKAEWWFGLQSN